MFFSPSCRSLELEALGREDTTTIANVSVMVYYTEAFEQMENNIPG